MYQYQQYTFRSIKWRYALFILVFIFGITTTSFAQRVTGKWYGTGKVAVNGEHDVYLTEMILQQNGNRVSGQFNYYFRKQFYTHNVSGTYNYQTRKLIINPIPILFYKSVGIIEADCFMKGEFTLLASRLQASLTGSFSATADYQYTCPVISFKLQYEKPTTDIEPQIKDTVVDNKLITQQQPEVTEYKQTNRITEVTDEIIVDSANIKVFVFDNGEVDSDTITLFYNNSILATKQKLDETPTLYEIKVDTSSNNVLSMYAENLGIYPPNTALFVIMDGTKRHEVIIVSDYRKTGAIRIRQRKPANPFQLR